MKKILIVIPLLLMWTQSFAGQANNSEREVVSSSSANPNMQTSANTSQKQNSSAGTLSKVIGVANMALGAVNAAACGSACLSCCAQAALHFAMGAMSFKQASNHGGAAYGSGMTGIDTSAWNNPFGDPNNPNKPPEVNHLSTDDSNKDKDLAALVNTGRFNEIKRDLFAGGINGIKMDPKSGKITDTNTGKTYDAASLADAKSMADAGFSAGDIAAAMSASSKAERDALKKMGLTTENIGAVTAENGYESGGAGGAGGTLSGAAGDVNNGGSGYGRGIASTGGVKVPSNQIAGLTKNFNGERIGVSAENIFNMMTRRYKTKEKQNSFFDPSEMVKMPQ